MGAQVYFNNFRNSSADLHIFTYVSVFALLGVKFELY